MKEKKVEYIELIYDLIFVYLIGQSNALLEDLESGFFSFANFSGYLLSSLVVLQVWYFSMLFINRYGRNSVGDHVSIFVNMYLLYYMGSGTRLDWEAYFIAYQSAWCLILLNLSLQYFLKLRRSAPWEEWQIKPHLFGLLLQAAVVIVSIFAFAFFGISLLWLPLLTGFAAVAIASRKDGLLPVNFEHLTERVMLFVVFTFGEMIVAIVQYFEGTFSMNILYLSLCAFLIVSGLFVSYGFMYNNVIDRQRTTTGNLYMFLHIFLIIALNDLTIAMDFMRDSNIEVLPKNIFLISSFLIYYLFLFIIGNMYGKKGASGRTFRIVYIALTVFFAIVMAALYQNGRASIAVSVAFVYAMFALIATMWKKEKSRG